MDDTDEYRITLAYAILDLQNKINNLSSYLIDNMDFIQGMGDVAETLAEVLITAMDKYDIANRLAVEQLYKSSEFFKHTISSKYANQNIVQEWFSDVIVDVIVAMSDYDRIYVTEWLDQQFKDWINMGKKIPSALTYEDRVNFGEMIFEKAVHELGAKIMALYVCRTLYIPFISVYYLRPMTDYPYYEDWIKELEKSRRISELKEKIGVTNFYKHLDKTDEEIEEIFKKEHGDV